MSHLYCTTKHWRRSVTVSQLALDWMRRRPRGHREAEALMQTHARSMPRAVRVGTEYVSTVLLGGVWLSMTTRCDWGGRLVTRVTVQRGG